VSQTLIVGTSWVHGAAALEIFGIWRSLVGRLNPDADILVVDAGSPVAVIGDPRMDVIRLDTNVGHLSRGGRDGWGRAFSVGVQNAIDEKYDWLACLDCDLLLARPVAEIIDKMARSGVKCAAPMAIPYQFTETACSLWNVQYLKDIDLIGKYDWEHPPANGLLPEQRIDQICAGEMFALPLRGFRNDMRITAEQLPRMFPQGIDWIHHAELPVLRKFLEMNDGR
jgi:hypothetical protein